MLFKDTKPGNVLYMFDRDQVSLTELSINKTSVPHYDNHSGFNSMDMVVDIEVNNGKVYTFKADSEIGYMQNDHIMISPNLDPILKGVETLGIQSEQAWNQRETYKNNMEKCNDILSNYSPAFKAKKETDERFTRIEDSVTKLTDLVTTLVKELKS